MCGNTHTLEMTWYDHLLGATEAKTNDPIFLSSLRLIVSRAWFLYFAQVEYFLTYNVWDQSISDLAFSWTCEYIYIKRHFGSEI